MKSSSDFQVFAKPVGGSCNLDCRYCYYLDKTQMYQASPSFLMPDIILEEYISQHIEASSEPVIRFSWHGGEPTLAGVDYYRRIREIQRRHNPPGRLILNGMQTNGTLLDDEWGGFLAEEGFFMGLSLDGPQELHDVFRLDRQGRPTFSRVMRGLEILRKHRIHPDILCVVNAENVEYPLKVYRFFKEIGADYITFLPLVEEQPGTASGASPGSVSAESWGEFLCAVFDEWVGNDIGRIKVQIFEEAARTAFGQEHSLCIFRPVCGDIPVIEHNGDFYSCDHFVDGGHHLGNIIETPLVEMLESPAQRAFGRAKLESLPRWCRDCEVLEMCNGECPKNRFIKTPDGEGGLNYLCSGYRRFFNHCRPFVEEVAEEWKKS